MRCACQGSDRRCLYQPLPHCDTERRFAGDAVQRRRGVPVRLLFQLHVIRRQRLPAPAVPRDAVLPGLPRHDCSLCKFYRLRAYRRRVGKAPRIPDLGIT